MMNQYRCVGCRRIIGYSKFPHSGLYCTLACADDFPVTENEFRDDVVELLDARGISRAVLAAYYGVSRQRLHMLLSTRRQAVRNRREGITV
jgi:hypothetical protein